jgi:uncharacterized secreted protein with C-terminal beta-propeller domain
MAASRRRFQMRFLALAGLIAPGLLIAGCPPTVPPPDNGDPTDPALVSFTSQDELLSYFRSQAPTQFQQRSLLDAFAPAAPTAAEGGAANDAGDSAGGDGNFTTTNLQEAGVDESDIVKSDGTYFYIVSGRSLRIVRAQPIDEMEELGRLDLDEPIDSIYLRGDKLIALANEYSSSGGPEILLIWPPFYNGGKTIAYEIDVADRENPAVARRLELDGSLATSRLTNDRLILVLSIVPNLPADTNPLAMATMTLDAVMPKASTASGRQDMVPWDRWSRPSSPDGYYTTAVVTLDADDVEQIVASIAVMSNSSTVYASPTAIYLTDADYDRSSELREYTAIHKFSFDAEGAARYAASGAVPGRLLNQFSLGEADGYLRVATHISPTFGFGGGIAVDVAAPPDTAVSSRSQAADEAPEVPSNAVFVLGQEGENLNVVGDIRDIAPNEQIYSARFIGNRGFLVTFRQIDPLFTIDLTDPENPRLAGELKIPGFSDYLHPFGENLLIGVGRSTAETPWGGVVPDAMQLSLFDVSDAENPTVIQQLSVGGYGSISDASYTHKAFTLTQDGPAVLNRPVHDPFAEWAGPEFDGLLIYQVTTEGFSEVGRIASVPSSDTYGWGWVEWRRGAFIGEDAYMITPYGVRAAPLADLEDTRSVQIQAPANDTPWIDVGEGGGGGVAVDGDEGVRGEP